MVTYNLRVSGIKRETEDSYTISLKQPGLKKIKYLPGQYLTIVVNINGRKYRRPYSFSSSPGINPDLEITIKRVFRGIVSNHIIDMIKEGDMLEVLPPMGEFFFDPSLHLNSHLFLWGAGSGVTPLMSILRSALALNVEKITLSVCNRTKSDIIFYHELIDLKNKFPLNFTLNLFCTREDSIDTLPGRIDLSSLTAIYGNNPNDSYHFICGPIEMKNLLKKGLADLKVKVDHIYSEDFEHLVGNLDLTGIETRNVNLMYTGKHKVIEVVKGKSILEAALDAEIDIPYSCQTGTCKLCKAKLKSGDVRILPNDSGEENLSSEERLLCCSYPLTDDVVLEIF
jgi:ring-1,2-phenylacetyl-CoA epoxidase subunit PaaE